MESTARRIAEDLLSIRAVFFRPDEPFTWASGIKSPVYCDNRLILPAPDVLMGTSTAGIAHAAITAQMMGLPMGYVRSSSKDHGRQNQIEGRLEKGQKVVVVEDLISTGGSVLEVVNVLREAGNSMLYYGRIIFTSLADLLRGRESINNLSGPVGIVTAIGQAASYGWQDLLELLALITINVGILNLLPFPALDGGKIVFLLIEAVTGHEVPEKIQSSLTVAAFALLFGLMIFATYNDILRRITGTV